MNQIVFSIHKFKYTIINFEFSMWWKQELSSNVYHVNVWYNCIIQFDEACSSRSYLHIKNEFFWLSDNTVFMLKEMIPHIWLCRVPYFAVQAIYALRNAYFYKFISWERIATSLIYF